MPSPVRYSKEIKAAGLSGGFFFITRKVETTELL